MNVLSISEGNPYQLQIKQLGPNFWCTCVLKLWFAGICFFSSSEHISAQCYSDIIYMASSKCTAPCVALVKWSRSWLSVTDNNRHRWGTFPVAARGLPCQSRGRMKGRSVKWQERESELRRRHPWSRFTIWAHTHEHRLRHTLSLSHSHTHTHTQTVRAHRRRVARLLTNPPVTPELARIPAPW